MRISALLVVVTCLLLCHAVTAEESQVKKEATLKEDEPGFDRAKSESRNKVAVIGCGPGAMFFLHALATKRKKYQETGDVEGLAGLPEVTVYERASEPGGVWRANSVSSRADSINMFGGLWSNSPSFELEFFDYTYDEHFDEPTPLYLPRSKLLQYMTDRVTQVEDVFQHVKFNTEVTWATFNDDTSSFDVYTKDLDTGEKSTNEFDYLIWAGGVQGAPNYPRNIHVMLEREGYAGLKMHSAEIIEFGEGLKDKNLVLIGDSFSAEDLTLQALKMGATHVYITSARKQGEASTTSAWPRNKAESLDCLPSAVIHNGTGLLCSEVVWNEGVQDYLAVQSGKTVELTDIAAVIYCTGYTTTMHYLDEDLQYECNEEEWSVPSGWTSQRNTLTKSVGHVKPSSKLTSSQYVCDNIYRHALISNPRMMYIYTRTPYFLPEIDATAWALASYVSGETVLPSEEEMETRNYLEKLDELHIPYLRYNIDSDYAVAIDPLYEQSNHWLNSSDSCEAGGYVEHLKEYMRHAIKLIARDQVAGGHGGGLGSYDALSPRGENLVNQFAAEAPSRTFPVIPAETEWRTFRDLDPTPFSSLYTGIEFASLPAPWMHLGDDGNLLSTSEAIEVEEVKQRSTKTHLEGKTRSNDDASIRSSEYSLDPIVTES